jgi:hypothetical protein
LEKDIEFRNFYWNLHKEFERSLEERSKGPLERDWYPKSKEWYEFAGQFLEDEWIVSEALDNLDQLEGEIGVDIDDRLLELNNIVDNIQRIAEEKGIQSSKTLAFAWEYIHPNLYPLAKKCNIEPYINSLLKAHLESEFKKDFYPFCMSNRERSELLDYYLKNKHLTHTDRLYEESHASLVPRISKFKSRYFEDNELDWYIFCAYIICYREEGDLEEEEELAYLERIEAKLGFYLLVERGYTFTFANRKILPQFIKDYLDGYIKFYVEISNLYQYWKQYEELPEYIQEKIYKIG